MKIEKLNDNQVKFILNHDDLKQWDIKLTELTQGTERTYELFRDMMEQALTQCDFHVDNTPLLIEAIPHSVDGIIIIVTKVSNTSEVDERFSLPPVSKLFERFRGKSLMDLKDQPEKQETAGKFEPTSVFSFGILDDATDVARRLTEHYWGHSALYKLDGRYFLLLSHDESSSRLSQEDIEAVLSEYGQKHAASGYSWYYLSEHGEVIIERSAVNVLSRF